MCVLHGVCRFALARKLEIKLVVRVGGEGSLKSFGIELETVAQLRGRTDKHLHLCILRIREETCRLVVTNK